jgi:hypothetical protein
VQLRLYLAIVKKDGQVVLAASEKLGWCVRWSGGDA